MRAIGQMTITRDNQSKAERIRHDARRFIDVLAIRLVELQDMAKLATFYDVFNAEKYAEFKHFFRRFSELCEEFQLLSQMTEESLAKFERVAISHRTEHRDLENYFRQLQIPMLHAVIRTNLQLLGVWHDRLRQGEGLPYGTREVFLETVRVLHNARGDLLRPRNIALLDEKALQDADDADHLLRDLIMQAPQLFDFAANSTPADLLTAENLDIDAILRSVATRPSALTAFG
jgi:hypothetical protein